MTGDRWDDLRGLDGSESWFPEMDGATIVALLAERDALAARLDLAEAALSVIAVGGNGEGWTMQDAVNLLRFAVGQEGVCAEWTEAVPPDERNSVERIVGADHPALRESGDPQ